MATYKLDDDLVRRFTKLPPRRQRLMRAMIAVAVLLAGSCGIDTDGGVNPRHLKYPSCEAAKKDGADLPLTPDKPGFNPELDKNNDGKMC